MIWAQSIAIILSIFGMGIAVILFVSREMRQISRDIASESKDFHGRLCKLEERYLELRERK